MFSQIHSMKKSTYFVILAICCSFLLVACEQNVGTPIPKLQRVKTEACQLELRVTVRQGVHAKQIFAGTVDFKDSSSISASMLEGEKSSDPISFYFDGPAIHFIIQTDQGRVFGTGLMESGPATCTGTGGGTQSGPAEGDLGDWRGEWVLTTSMVDLPTEPDLPAPEPLPSPNSFSTLFIVGVFVTVVLLILVALVLVWLFRPYKSGKKLMPSKKNAPVKKSDVKTRTDGAIVEYLTTYTQDDLLFDLSFPIENASQYLGEYGINIAKAFGVKSDQAIALEIWLFDKNGSQSASKILMSEFAFTHDALKNEMEKKGQVVQIRPGETIEMETTSLRLQAKVLEVEYDSSQPNPRTIFKKVEMQIGIWPKSG